MESLRQKDAGLVKVMEEALLRTIWGTSECLHGLSLSRGKKKLENIRQKPLDKYPAWLLVCYPMFLKLKITIVLIYRAYNICQPRY